MDLRKGPPNPLERTAVQLTPLDDDAPPLPRTTRVEIEDRPVEGFESVMPEAAVDVPHPLPSVAEEEAPQRNPGDGRAHYDFAAADADLVVALVHIHELAVHPPHIDRPEGRDLLRLHDVSHLKDVGC